MAGGVIGQLAIVAEQAAFVPPPDPLHDQFHGPLPVTLVAVPAEHRLVVGAVVRLVPFADPHTPFSATVHIPEEQFAAAPPLAPAHVHVQGPVPETALGAPTSHSADGVCGAEA